MLNLHKCEFYTLHPRIQVLKQFLNKQKRFFSFFPRRLFKRQTSKGVHRQQAAGRHAMTTGTKARRHQRSPGKLLVPGHCPSASPPPKKKARQVRTGQASALLQGQIYTCKASVAPRSQPTSFPGPPRLQPSPHHPPGPSSSKTRFWPMVCSA